MLKNGEEPSKYKNALNSVFTILALAILLFMFSLARRSVQGFRLFSGSAGIEFPTFLLISIDFRCR